MAAPGLVGGTEELELIRQAVTVAKSELPSVVHMCVSPDTGRGKLLRKLGFTQVRTYLDMLWSEESLPEADLPAVEAGHDREEEAQPQDAAVLPQRAQRRVQEGHLQRVAHGDRRRAPGPLEARVRTERQPDRDARRAAGARARRAARGAATARRASING